MSRSPFAAAGLIAIAAVPAATQAPDSASFVTRLGADTIAVERLVRTPTRVEAIVVLRIPQTTMTHYVMELSAAGEWIRMESATAGGTSHDVVRRERVTRDGDSLRVETTTDQGTREQSVAAASDVLPFIDMVHWPYEVALMRVSEGSASNATIPALRSAK